MDLNIIYNENCIETLKRFPDNSIDIVITSPPYNMNLRVRKGKYCSRQIVKEEFSTKYDDFDDNLPIEEFYELHRGIIQELLRVSKVVFYNIQIVTGSKRAFFKIIGEFNENLKDIIVWDKGHGQPAMLPRVLNRRTELLLVFTNDAITRQFEDATFERGTLDDIWQIKRAKKINKEHGATFPEELVETILNNFSKEGDIVYDPFMGTGTTAVVAKNLNRKYLGSELSKKYCEDIEARLSEKKP